jgi:RNA polymerase sigma-70 factor (ECF subfamily)
MGKESRFEELFLPYLDAAYNLARWMVGRDQDAADIVHEAYARALQGFSQFRGDNPRAWLLAIVRNTADSSLTKPHREKERIRLDEESAPPPSKIVLSGLSQERQQQLLEEALTRLPAEFREVLLLFEIERWSYQAIATALDEPLEAVIARLCRARRRLQKEFASPHQVSDSRGGGPSRAGGETGCRQCSASRTGSKKRSISESTDSLW